MLEFIKLIKHLLTIRQLVNQGKLRFYWYLVQSIKKKEKVAPEKMIEINEKREFFYDRPYECVKTHR